MAAGSGAGSITTASRNTFIGYQTGAHNGNGNNNTYIGWRADSSVANLSSVSAIGACAQRHHLCVRGRVENTIAVVLIDVDPGIRDARFDASLADKAMAVLSLAAWLAVLYAGRMLPFLGKSF